MNLGAKLMSSSTRLLVSIVLILAAMVLLFILGPDIFKNLDAPKWFSVLVYALTIILGAVFLWITYKSRNNTYLMALIKPVMLFGLVLGFAYIGARAFPPTGPFNPCTEIFSQVDKSEDPNTDEYLLNECLYKKPDHIVAKQAELGLAHAYTEQVEELVEANNSDRCDDMNKRLKLALNIAQKYNQDQSQNDLVRVINEDAKDVTRLCTVAEVTPIPTASPLPDHYILDVISQRKVSDSVTVDFRIIKNNVEADMGFTAENFVVKQDQTSLPFRLEIRTSADPVCLIAVVDNSGSINSGLNKILDAVQVLNIERKPGDELGLVIFDKTAQIIRRPEKADFQFEDINQVKGNGELTALWPAVSLALDTAKSCDSQNRYLIVLTDGAGNIPSASVAKNIEQAQKLAEEATQAQVNICPVGIQSNELQEEPLYLLATGCSYFEAARLDDKSGMNLLSDKIKNIVGMVHDFYRVSFSKPTSVEKLYLQFLISGSFVDEKLLTLK